MKAYWTDKKLDGTPITDGRLCRVVDPEDGSEPIRVYGANQEEVYSKIERTMTTAQATISHLRTAPQNGGQNGNRQPAPATNPALLSADQLMVTTAELQMPNKSAAASLKLQQHELARLAGIKKSFFDVCDSWTAAHPEFFRHKTNDTLLVNKALLTTGNNMAAVTPEILDACYRSLSTGGFLLTESDVAPQLPPTENNPQPSASHTDGSRESVTERQPGGDATSHRSNRLSTPRQPSRLPKFTKAELDKLTTQETVAMNSPKHPRHNDFLDACNYWYSGAQATA